MGARITTRSSFSRAVVADSNATEQADSSLAAAITRPSSSIMRRRGPSAQARFPKSLKADSSAEVTARDDEHAE